MTCRSCHYSSHYDGFIWCLLKQMVAKRRCPSFIYEPESDE